MFAKTRYFHENSMKLWVTKFVYIIYDLVGRCRLLVAAGYPIALLLTSHKNAGLYIFVKLECAAQVIYYSENIKLNFNIYWTQAEFLFYFNYMDQNLSGFTKYKKNLSEEMKLQYSKTLVLSNSHKFFTQIISSLSSLSKVWWVLLSVAY